MSNGRKILDGLEDALSRNVSRYTNIYTADMSDLERARGLIQYWKDCEQYVGQHMSLSTNFETFVPLITAALAVARREGAEEMRERAVRAAQDCLGVEVRYDGVALRLLVTEAIRALPLTLEEPI